MRNRRLGMVVHTHNPRTQEAEAGVQGQTELHSEFKASWNYTVRPYPKKLRTGDVAKR
jgi:hypothetical protein